MAEFGIRLDAVVPGLTDIPLMRTWITAQPDPDAFERGLAATIAQRRFGLPEDMAAAVAYPAADESAHIIGVSIPVDGGYTAAS